MNILRNELRAKRRSFNSPIEMRARFVAWFVKAFFETTVLGVSDKTKIAPAKGDAHRGARGGILPKSKLSGVDCGAMRFLRHRQRFLHHFPQQRSARNRLFLATPDTTSLFAQCFRVSGVFVLAGPFLNHE